MTLWILIMRRLHKVMRFKDRTGTERATRARICVLLFVCLFVAAGNDLYPNGGDDDDDKKCIPLMRMSLKGKKDNS